MSGSLVIARVTSTLRTMPRWNRARTSKSKKKRKGTRIPRGRWLTAATSDPYILYEKSVQDPEGEVDFIDQVWKERRTRRPSVLREDFCGTAIACCAWVKRRSRNIAYAVDIDHRVLDWARAKIPRRLDSNQRARLHLLEEDVLTVRTEPVDTVVAMNFSYFLFKRREALREYFARVHSALCSDGIFIIDAYGGSDSFSEMEEERDCDGFTYVWDQNVYNPITGEVVNHIHFRFPDRTELKKAFTYDWRLWTLPELRETLAEAGFARSTIYWEGEDKYGEGTGEFTPSERGDASAAWIAYIVAEK